MVAHAHDYRVEVTLRGQIDSETGFVTDLQALEKTLADFVVAPINDRAFHEAVDRFSGGGVQPSTEEIARWIWEVISPELSGPATLQSVRVHESDRLSVEYRGPGLHHPVP